jgi:triosephosphate isomerase
MIVINFKNYVYGKKSLELAKKVQKYLPNSIVAVSSADARGIDYYTKLKVFSQHVDFTENEKTTGFINIETLKQTGAKGSLLNHSEHRLKEEIIEKIILKANKLNFKIILCIKNLYEVEKYKRLKPHAIAFEDTHLISTGKSITKYNSESIKKFVKILKGTKIIPLCGAGINSKEDITEAKRLGCKGVLIASAIAEAKNPEKILRGLK